MPDQDRRTTGDARRPTRVAQVPANHGSAADSAWHHVRTRAGLVSLSWDPDQGMFIAARGRQTWADSRLGDLARTVGMKVPADVARDLRRHERLHPGPRVQIRPAYTPPPTAHPPHPQVPPAAPVPPAGPTRWPPDGSYLVPSRHGQVAIAWQPEHHCYVGVTAAGDRWRADHLDDLAIKAGARIPRAYVEDLLRDAGRPLPTWDPPTAETGKEWAEWQAAPVAVPALLDGLPPGVAEDLKSALAAPSQSEPGGVARVETARRTVRAEWGAWAQEAGARRQLIEDLDSVMQGLARGDLLHQAVQRLEGLADRYSRQVDIERSPTIGAHVRANREAAPTTASTAVDRLHALRSRPATPAAAVGRA